MSRSAGRRELAEPQEMTRKSRFFSSPVYAGFADDFQLLLGLPTKKLDTLLAAIPALVVAPEPDELEKEFEELAGKLSTSGQQVYQCVRMVRYSLLRIQEDLANPDEPSLWATDFIALFERDPAKSKSPRARITPVGACQADIIVPSHSRSGEKNLSVSS